MTRARIDPMTLPVLKKWREHFASSVDVWDYLGSQPGGLTIALAFAHLFWPEFVEVRGCVLLARAYEQDAFERWWHELSGERCRIEQVVNHVHLYDVFTVDAEIDPQVTNAVLMELGEILVACWTCALAARFPGRTFHVEMRSEEEEYGPTIYFFTEEKTIGALP